jgi:hypothetical protein
MDNERLNISGGATLRRLQLFGEKIFFHCRTVERAEDLDAYKICPH